MINVSNQWKEVILSERNMVAKAEITLTNGIVLNVTEANIVVGGFKISDSVSSGNKFQIGSAIINQLTLHLNNIEGQFSQHDFTGAVIRPWVGLKFETTTEWIKKGVFVVDDAKAVSSVIIITALDNLNKFDTPFSSVPITFPCTALQLLQATCLYCQVSLATSTFLNSNFTIGRKPNDEATTCREIISHIAQLSGNFARCNVDGALELKWYDFGAFETEDNLDGGVFDDATPYSTGDSADGGDFTFSETTDYNGGTFLDTKRYHHIYSLGSATIATDDIAITGIQVKAVGIETDYGETVIFGTTGYVISIENPLIQEGNANLIASTVGQKIVGMRFRPCSITAVSDPSREAGDVAKLSDSKRNVYNIMMTSVNFSIGSMDSIRCDAETASAKQSVRFDDATKTIVEARKVIKQEISSYDLAVQQLNAVALNAMGYYPTTVIQEDGSRIEYAHDKPTLAESQIVYKKSIDGFFISNDGGLTYTSGFTADGNILANVLTAIGVNANWINVVDNFSVGNKFNVDSLGKLTASDAEITGKITASSGKIAEMDINDSGLSKVYPIQGDIYTGILNLVNGFNLSFSNASNSRGCGINVFHGDNGEPRLNLYARNEGGLDNDNILLNGSPVLNNLESLQTAFYKLQTWAIQLGYEP